MGRARTALATLGVATAVVCVGASAASTSPTVGSSGAVVPQGMQSDRGYAGSGGKGSRAVLEVRSREVPFILEDGQIVGRLVYEKMLARPDTLYGQGIGSNYQAQGLKLSKHFKV